MKKRWILALVIATAAIGSQIDDALEPEAEAWLAAVDDRRHGDSEAFYLLLGLDAAADQDAVSAGRALMNAIRAVEAQPFSPSEPPQFPEHAAKLTPPTTDEGPFCRFVEADCLPQLFTRHDWQPLLGRYQVVLARYQQLLTLDDFRTLTQASPAEPISPFLLLIRSQRLYHLTLLGGDDPAAQLAQLVAEHQQLRRLLARQDQLVGKVVVINLVANNLELMAGLLARQPQLEKPPLPALSDEERDFSLALAHEFALNASGYRQLADSPELFEVGGHLPLVISRALYKPNMSINTSFAFFQQVSEVAALPQAQFAEAPPLASDPEEYRWSARNYVGNILTAIAAPDFVGYIAIGHDLNSKIALFNGIDFQRRGSDGRFALPAIANPYGGDGPFYLAERRAICLPGPLADERKIRCLPDGKND